MAHLSLVKSLAHLKEERKHSDEVDLRSVGLVLARGSLAEIVGDASTGKTSIALSLLAKLTSTGEICAVVDCGGFDPCSAVLSGVELENLLWVRCGGDVEEAFMATDYLVQAKGFGCIWLNLNGIPKRKIRYVPKTYWYRYRTRIKETPTILLVTAGEHVTGSASQDSFVFEREASLWSGEGNFKLLREFHLSFLSRKEFFGEPRRLKVEMDYSQV